MDDEYEPRRSRPSDEEWSDDLDGWQPARRRRPLWQRARLAGLLAVVLIALVGAALILPGVSVSPPPSPSPTQAASATAVARPPTPTPSPTFVRPTPTPGPTFVTHLVERGDNLTAIARRYGTTPRSIAFWNRETYPTLDPESADYNPNNIQIGWRLQLIPGMVYDELSGGSPAPASPTPGPTSIPAPGSPAATSGGASVLLASGSRDSNRVALTFDMGGRLDPAVDIVDWLIANRVQATVFPTGREATEQEAGMAVAERVRDHPELFELGNHSWDHPSFTDLSPGQIRDQLRLAEERLLASVGRTTRPWFRPPFGSWNQPMLEVVGAEGWGYTVLWDIDTIDWRPTSEGGPTADDIETRVVSAARGGSIVLMHLGGWNTLEALPGVLAGLQAKGLQPVTLSELVRG